MKSYCISGVQVLQQEKDTRRNRFIQEQSGRNYQQDKYSIEKKNQCTEQKALNYYLA